MHSSAVWHALLIALEFELSVLEDMSLSRVFRRGRGMSGSFDQRQMGSFWQVVGGSRSAKASRTPFDPAAVRLTRSADI